MSRRTPAFRRHIGPAFVEALHELVESPQGRWWRDVLAHPDLKIAIRYDTIDVYHWGASIFRITMQEGRVVARTHFKYMVRQRQGHASLIDGKFVHEAGKALWAEYEGRETLDEMIAATKPLAGPEKAGLHPLIMYPKVIDLEIAFRNEADSDLVPNLPDDDIAEADPQVAPKEAVASTGTNVRQDRLDAATLEDRDGKLWVVFHEAKHFTNPELRAGPSRPPPITEQIERYRRAIERHADDIKASYHEVSKALLELHAMRVKAGSTSTVRRTDRARGGWRNALRRYGAPTDRLRLR